MMKILRETKSEQASRERLSLIPLARLETADRCVQ
jgi:hypothetical protein